MTMLPQTGIYGAKRQTWKRASPRDLLKRMMDNHSDDTEGRLHQRFSMAVQDNPDMLESIIEYWFANNYRSLSYKPAKDERARAEMIQRAERLIRSRAETLVLSDMVLPNGKKLREATGLECSKFAPKVGNLLSKIAKKVKPSQIVGDVLSEEQLRRMYGDPTK